MDARTALVVVLILGLVALSGCIAAPNEVSTSTATRTTTSAIPKATETTTVAPTTTQTTEEPQYGDNLLYTSEVNASSAMAADTNKRANFSELNAAQQALFNQTYNCSCYVVQEEFTFNDDSRIEYVNYEGQWYFLRVAIV